MYNKTFNKIKQFFEEMKMFDDSMKFLKTEI